jgi:hypothetical protein
MSREPLPPTLDHVTRDVWDTCRQSLIFAGRLLDFLAFNVPGIGAAVDRAQLALDAVFDEIQNLPQSFPQPRPPASLDPGRPRPGGFCAAGALLGDAHRAGRGRQRLPARAGASGTDGEPEESLV